MSNTSGKFSNKFCNKYQYKSFDISRQLYKYSGATSPNFRGGAKPDRGPLCNLKGPQKNCAAFGSTCIAHQTMKELRCKLGVIKTFGAHSDTINSQFSNIDTMYSYCTFLYVVLFRKLIVFIQVL